MRHFLILTFLLPAIGGLSGIIEPIKEGRDCIGSAFAKDGDRIDNRGAKPIRDIKLIVRDTGRCFKKH